MFSVYRKEITGFLNTLIAYLVMIVFITFIGLFMWVFTDSNVMDAGFSDMESLFTFGPIAFLLLIPAVTMRSFAEEKKDGTIELLMTKPLTDWQIILGKYFASFSLVAVALAPTLVYYFSIYSLGNPVGNIDSAAVFSSYIGLLLLGGVFTSIGLLASSLTSNQIFSFILSLIICYFFYDGLSRIADLNLWEGSRAFITSFSLSYHYDALSKGLIDSRNLVYFISITLLMLLSSNLVLGSRKW
ncbi:MAG TPA: gliding motility-associated ABC transporter permease subunit GldF [Cytophagaceae bacterium]|jgi:ABC-2 type transport system permease protein|nr:gliding motility-associated ABC transporter permease subunit GldF [Cytophagaceae bacterium]